MCGWFSAATARASRSKRSEKASFVTLMATTRSSRVSRARYTSPMPPAPIGPTISYGPRRVPGTSGMKYSDYSDVRPADAALLRDRGDVVLARARNHARIAQPHLELVHFAVE